MSGAEQRERGFWDAQARGFDPAALKREAGFVAEEGLWRWLAAEVASRRPRRLLDAGCGRGATTWLLARAGQPVIGLDVAPVALAQGRRLCRAEGAGAAFVAGTLERLPFAGHSFEVVAGRFVLHHAASLEEAAAELDRVLVPGGTALFVETWGHNPLLRLGRELAGLGGIGLGTADERPLGREDLRVLRRWFRVETDFPQFVAVGLLNRLWRRLKPLAVRSRRFRDLLGWLWSGSLAADRWLERRLPALRPWGYYVALRLSKPPLPPPAPGR